MKGDNSRLDYTILLFIIALFVFNSPFATWWSRLHLPWYTIFLVWLAIIIMIAAKQRHGDSDGHN